MQDARHVQVETFRKVLAQLKEGGPFPTTILVEGSGQQAFLTHGLATLGDSRLYVVATTRCSSKTSSATGILQHLMAQLSEIVLSTTSGTEEDKVNEEAISTKLQTLDPPIRQTLASLLSHQVATVLLPCCDDDQLVHHQADMEMHYWTLVKQAIRSFLIALSSTLDQSIILVVENIQEHLQDGVHLFEVLQFLLTTQNMLSNVCCCITLMADSPKETQGDDSDNLHPSYILNWLEEIEKLQRAKQTQTSTTSLVRISLDNLTREEIHQVLRKCLMQDENNNNFKEMAGLLYDRTHGNIDMIEHVLEFWQDQGWIIYNFASDKCQFVGNLEKIHQLTPLSDNVADLLCAQMKHKYPPHVQKTIQLLAAIFLRSSRIDSNVLQSLLSEKTVLLANITGDDNSIIFSGILDACQENLLIHLTGPEYRFAHENISASAYKLFLETLSQSSHDDAVTCNFNPSRFHFEIGYALLQKMGETLEKAEPNMLCTCADQLRLGMDGLSVVDMEPPCNSNPQQKDVEVIAKLFLVAGKRAQAESDHHRAAEYFQNGVCILRDGDAFRTHYELAIEMYTLSAQAELRVGHTCTSQQMAEMSLKHATKLKDKIPNMMVLQKCFHAQVGDFDKIVTVSLDMLKSLGEPAFPRKPNWLTLRWECEKAMRAFRSQKLLSTEDVLGMPPMSGHKALVMSILHAILAPAVLVPDRHAFFIVASARMVCLTLEFGLCEWSATAIASFALVLLGYMTKTKESLQMAEFSVQLLESFPSAGAGTCSAFSGIIMSHDPSRKFLDLLKRGYDLSMQVGDGAEAFTALTFYSVMHFYDGVPLDQLSQDMESFTSQMLDFGQLPCFLMNLPTWQCLLNLSGNTACALDMEHGDAIDRQNLVGGNPHGIGYDHLLSFWMQVAFYMGDLSKALELKKRLATAKYDDASKLISKHCPFHQARLFFYGLICIANYREHGKRNYLVEGKKYHQLLSKLVKKGFIKLVHKFQLMDAELQSLSAYVKNDPCDILRKYDAAIVSAARSGYLQDSALANYLCGRYCLKGDERLKMSAAMYLHKSHEMYTTWGAVEVANSVVQRHPEVFKDHPHTTASGNSMASSK